MLFRSSLRVETEVLRPLSRIAFAIIGLYFFLKVGDLTIREVWGHMFEGSYQSNWFLLEFFIGIVAPLVMLMSKKVRESTWLLFTAASLYIVFGVLLNRINVFFVAYKPPYATEPYFPAIGEFALTIGLISALVLIYRIIVKIFPILPAHESQT